MRFAYNVRGVRELKDAMSREILSGLEKAGISIASATFEIIVGARTSSGAQPIAPAESGGLGRTTGCLSNPRTEASC